MIRYTPGTHDLQQMSIVVVGISSGGGGSGSDFSTAIMIDSSKEQETRQIAKAMGGHQPNEFEWSIFFMRSGGGMASETHEKMRAAHEIAKAQPSIDARVDRVVEFLSACGNADIASGVGYIMGNGSDEQISAFRQGIANSLRDPT